MLNHQHLRRRSRLILVLAGLLYLIGAVADPLVHAVAERSGVVEIALSDTETETPEHSAPVVPHGDSECLLCKVSGAVFLPEAASQVSEEVRESRGTFALVEMVRGPPSSPLTLPRAPPRL
jgi:hypothetical protein